MLAARVTLAAPSGAEVLARSDRCMQAFRLGDMAWGVQFHPEITRTILEEWFAGEPDEIPGPPDELLIPGRRCGAVHALHYWAGAVPHCGINDAMGYFLVSYEAPV